MLFRSVSQSRYGEPGGDSQPIRIGKRRVGVTICEDIWNDEDVWPVRRYRRDPVRELTKKGIDLLVNLSASPWNIGKEQTRYRLLREVALRSKIPVVQVNAVGGNDELVFDGQSLAVGRKGGVLAQGAAFGEQSWVVDLDGRETKPEWAPKEEQVFRALVLGTLREEVLVFMKINEKFEVVESVRVDMNERIRDLEVLSNGSLLATTDEGNLITVSNS